MAFLEVQPDVMLVKYRDDYYSRRHPETEDVYVLMEVADESLDFDRGRKLPWCAYGQLARALPRRYGLQICLESTIAN